MADDLLSELEALFLKLFKEQLTKLCVSLNAAKAAEISEKSVFHIFNTLNHHFEKELTDEDHAIYLLSQVKTACLQYLRTQSSGATPKGAPMPSQERGVLYINKIE